MTRWFWICLLVAFLPSLPLAEAAAAPGVDAALEDSIVAALSGCNTNLATPVVSKVDPMQVGLGNRKVTVTVQGLSTLLEKAGGCQKLSVFLDGSPLKGVPVESCNPNTCRVRFHLDRNEENDAVWHTLLRSPTGFTRKVLVSVGPSQDEMITTLVEDSQLEILPPTEFYIFVAILGVTLLVFLYLTRRTDILRNPHVVPPEGAAPPYDLGRFQMAFWFFLVVSAYVFIWMVTQELDTITGSVLGLLAIGSGTALGSSLIDGERPDSPAKEVRASRGFLHDVLHDARGLSLYRFQLFVWTLVLGVIFCISVYDGLAMPQFNPTLLGLMGISSGTFLGAKFPER